jgi:hypothetical protein
MSHPFSSLRAIRALVSLATLAIAVPALAASQRTFVASFGIDVGTCALLAPCRSFNFAISQTNAGGEVIILDTAGYGGMTITKSIKIIGPSGVYGGISVLGGASPTTGIVINAGDTDVVTLRGLDISGVPAVPPVLPLPLIGVDIQNVGAVHIEKSSIGNFTQDTSACIHAVAAKPLAIFVNDSFLRDCRNGIFVDGTGPDDASRISLVVDNTRIEHMVNTTAGGTVAVNLNDAVVASFRNSVLSWGGDGLLAHNTNTAVRTRIHIVDSQLTRFGNGAIETLGVPSASLHVTVATSYFNNSNAALLHGHGQAIFTSNVISNHNFSLVDCGGGAASVTSLGYSGGNGSNSVSNNADVAPFPTGCTGIITPTQFQGK